jgi:hypothetical protein
MRIGKKMCYHQTIIIAERLAADHQPSTIPSHYFKDSSLTHSTDTNMKLDVSILLVLVATTASEETTSACLLKEESMSTDLSLSFNAGFMGTTTPMTMRKSKSGKAVKDPICKLPFAKTTPLCSVCKDQKFHFYVD